MESEMITDQNNLSIQYWIEIERGMTSVPGTYFDKRPSTSSEKSQRRTNKRLVKYLQRKTKIEGRRLADPTINGTRLKLVAGGTGAIRRRLHSWQVRGNWHLVFENVSYKVGIGNKFGIQNDTDFGIQSTVVRLITWRKELTSLHNSFFTQILEAELLYKTLCPSVGLLVC